MKAVKLTLKTAMLAELAAQGTALASPYLADKATKPIIIESYEVETLEGKYGEWRKVKFQAEGQDKPFSINVKGNREIDTEEPVMIQRFVCQEDYETSGGAVIKAGTAKWFAVQTS